MSSELRWGKTIAWVLTIGALTTSSLYPASNVSAQVQRQLVDVPTPTPRPNIEPTGAPPASTSTELLRGKRLTLAEAVFLGIRGNRSIRSSYIDRVVQKFDLRVVEDRFTPQLALSGSIARQRIGNVDSTEIGASPGVSVHTRTGARFQFGWVNTFSSDETGTIGNSSLDLTFEQPLLRGAGVAVNVAPVEIAQLGEQINRLQMRATVSETISNIVLAHRSLIIAQEELALAKASVGRAQILLKTNRMLIDAGRLPSIDAIQTEADLERQRLRVLSAERNRQQAALALMNLLGLDLGSTIVATETLDPQPQKLDLRHLLNVAFQKRPDLKGQLHVLDQARKGSLIAKNQQLWDISFFANARRNLAVGNATSSNDSMDLRAGLRFEIPVRDLARESLLLQSTASEQSALLQYEGIKAGVEAQIRNTVSDISISWQKISVATRSLKLARQSVDIELLKLNVGRSSSFAVGILEGNLREAESQLLASRIDYLNALTQLDLALGTTLDTWKISLRD